MKKGSAGKIVLDYVAVIVGVVCLIPVIAFIAVLVLFYHGSPVLFRQIRPGLYGAPFEIYKFRTMTAARDSEGNLLSDDQRLTRFGRFLRCTSLDELPELLNVFKGDMSLVGPRPLFLNLNYF